jgi:hypothetical protein
MKIIINKIISNPIYIILFMTNLFDKKLFDDALTLEYKDIFNLDDTTRIQEQQEQVNSMKSKGEEINELVESGASSVIVGSVLDSLTTKDVYKTALKLYNNNRDAIFTCGIERTFFVFTQGQNPKESWPAYTKKYEGTSIEEMDVKISYIKTILFDCFMTYCIKNKFTIHGSYRLFIRLLCLSDGIAILLIPLASNNINLTTVSSSPPSSPPQVSAPPAPPIEERNQNIITGSPGNISLTTALVYRLVNPSTMIYSQPFQIPIMYDLFGLSNRPFNLLFSTLSYLNDSLSEITFDSFINLRRAKANTMTVSKIAPRFHRGGGQSRRKKSHCKHLHSRHKKNGKKYTCGRRKSKMNKNKYRKYKV